MVVDESSPCRSFLAPRFVSQMPNGRLIMCQIVGPVCSFSIVTAHVSFFLCSVDVVQVRSFPVNSKDHPFAQITVRFDVEQRVADAAAIRAAAHAASSEERDALLASLPAAQRRIEYYVFERALTDPEGAWRVCDRLVTAPSS